MNNTKLKQLIFKVLKTDERLWNEDKTELNQTLLLDLMENIDEKVIDLLLQEKDLREKFFVKIKDVYVFKTNDFRFFMEENKINNSYTDYKNRIGLTDSKKFLKDTNDVVLDFPYKDCVLEGGQSTEEGTDTYFEFSDKTEQYEEKQGKRKEIFFNSVLAHDEIDRLFDAKALTNWKRFTKDGEEEVKKIKRDKDGTIKENLIIKGNNLLALHSLKKQFSGKVKLIYIDPPYNKDVDSFYNDNFNHSTWLTFMKNRLEVAKELLTEDGIIYVQIDDKEHAYLKVLMDDNRDCKLFGRENFLTNILVKTKTPSGVGQESYIFTITENILVYVKNKSLLKPNNYKIFDELLDENSKTCKNYNLMIDSFGSEESSYNLETGSGRPIKVVKLKDFAYNRTSPKKCTKEWYYNNYEKIFRLSPANGGLMKKITPKLPKEPCYIEYVPTKGKYADKKIKIYFVNRDMAVFISESSNKDNKEKEVNKLVNVHNSWTDDSLWQGIAKEGGVVLKNGKKPEGLIKRILEISTKKNDIVLDYHLGSGTTCSVAHKMGRQYIGTEQLDYAENDSVVRLQNVINGDQSGISKSVNWQGGGDFIYFELAKWNETAKEKILECEISEELIKFFDEMYEKYFLNYNLKIKEFREKVIKEEEFKNLSLDEQKKMFVAMLDNNQMYVNKTEMADKKFGIDKEDQNLTSQFYNSEK